MVWDVEGTDDNAIEGMDDDGVEGMDGDRGEGVDDEDRSDDVAGVEDEGRFAGLLNIFENINFK